MSETPGLASAQRSSQTSSKWLRWSEIPWLTQSSADGPAVHLCSRLLDASLSAESVPEFLRDQLWDVATDFSAQWVALIRRTPEWQIVHECGRHSISQLPYRLFSDALDREAAGQLSLDEPAGWSIAAVPTRSEVLPGHLLILAGRQMVDGMLPAALVVAQTLAACVAMMARKERDAARIERLGSTLKISSAFASARESEPLLELIAEEATRLLNCDRASIFIWDKEQHEVVACPALGVEGGSLRLPDDVGIVGEVMRSRRSIHVADAYSDARFNKSVDKDSGYTTRNLLCSPLLDASGQLVGAFEAINKREGAFGEADEQSLSELGVQASIALKNTQEREQLVRSRDQLAEQLTSGVRIIGNSPAISALRDTISRLAKTDLPVLVLGESGTGKEVVSQVLHYQGNRAEFPFVAVNCAALTESLLESELFGHEKGAFTDAREARQGKFELAHGGTLFLDEIGDMSPNGQAKLLRVLEQKIVTRVGGSQGIPIDVRVVAATNRDLADSVRQGRFRQDLYYRLTVVTLELPALRERPEDIITLAEYFLGGFCKQASRPVMALSDETRRRLQAHGWPGNVRELRNLMERVAFLATGARVEAEDLAFILSPERDSPFDPSLDQGLKEATQSFQQEFIRRSIKRVQGNMSEAARLLGLHRSNLYRKMRQLEMSEANELDDGL